MATSSEGPTAVFDALARALAARDWPAAADLYAPDVTVTNRFDPSGPTTKRGRAAVHEFFADLGGKLDSLTVEHPVLTPGADGETLTAEFTFAAAAGGGRVHFTLPAIFVMRVVDGHIVESRDYIGPQHG